jgi:hypothetical protein
MSLPRDIGTTAIDDVIKPFTQKPILGNGKEIFLKLTVRRCSRFCTTDEFYNGRLFINIA